MAGAGYNLFLTGSVLTAAQVNNYLQEQAVMRFASSAARTSALSAVLAEGMMSYLADTNAVEVYNGSAWVAVGGATPLTTKGDLFGYNTGNARVPIGTNGQILTADSTEALGLKWATPAGGGKVLQVVSTSTVTNTTIASTTYTDVTNMTLNITPTSASSKVLVLVTLPSAALVSTAGDTTGNSMRILRGATVITNYYNSGFGDGGAFYVYAGGPGANIGGVYGVSFLDSPATTSATTYKVQGRVLATANSGTAYFGGGATAAGSVILMEIGA